MALDSAEFIQRQNQSFGRARTAAFIAGLRVLRNSEEADESAQVTMLELWRHQEEVDLERIVGLGVTVGRNRAIDRARLNSRSNHFHQPCVETTADTREDNRDPQDIYERRELRLQVHHALEALSPHHKTALILHEVDGLSCEEVGSHLGISGKAVKSLLFRARDQFRRKYQQSSI